MTVATWVCCSMISVSQIGRIARSLPRQVVAAVLLLPGDESRAKLVLISETEPVTAKHTKKDRIE